MKHKNTTIKSAKRHIFFNFHTLFKAHARASIHKPIKLYLLIIEIQHFLVSVFGSLDNFLFFFFLCLCIFSYSLTKHIKSFMFLISLTKKKTFSFSFPFFYILFKLIKHMLKVKKYRIFNNKKNK